jgi:EAL domain-containing protein (putative c-di-GMP-specific phosphodiesterase class I)
MGPTLLFATQVVVYAALPIALCVLQPPIRLTLFYVYISVTLVVSSFLGSVFAFPLWGDTSVSAGSVAYGALMMTTLMLVVLARDSEVVRNVIRIVVVVNVFKFGVFTITGHAIETGDYPNEFDTSASVFSTSLRVSVVGGALIIGELLLLVGLLERLKRGAGIPRLSLLAVGFFVGVLCLDGVLFPLLVTHPEGSLAELIAEGVAAKFAIAAAFVGPFVAFLVAFRSSASRYAATPLRLQELLVAPKADLVREIVRQRAELDVRLRELAASTDRQDQRVSVARALSALEADAPIDANLDAVGAVLRELPGVRDLPLGLLAVLDDVEVREFGRRPAASPPAVADLVARSAGGVWVEPRDLDHVACVPLLDGDVLAGVLEVRIDVAAADAAALTLGDVAFVLASLFRSGLADARRRWADRSPILALLATGSVTAVFQPIVDLSDGAVVGFEGLSRFEPGISPEERFREAAQLGLGVELELLAIRTILDAARVLPARATVAVNVSPATVHAGELAAVLDGCGRTVELELTEHDRVEDYDRLLAAIRGLGDVRVVVDDAGSGYASLQHILRLRPDEVKLDRAWVYGIDGDRPRQVLVEGLRSFVEEIDAELVAEGIERTQEASTLRGLGVRHGQGYLFARPLPAEAFAS